jgi:transposase-like protein
VTLEDGMYRFTPWQYLIRFEPEEAKRRITSALKQTGGNRKAAAKALDISPVQLRRYCVFLGMDGPPATRAVRAERKK